MSRQGVYPAVTAQFHTDESLDLGATQRLIAAPVDAGVDDFVVEATLANLPVIG